MEQTEKKLVAFLDSVSRTVIGKVANETDEVLEIQNPVVVHVVPQQDQAGQMRMSLQLYPIFFREFMADKDSAVSWKYNKKTITLPAEPLVFDFKLHAQYEQLFAPAPMVPQGQQMAPQGQQMPPQGQQMPPQGQALKFPQAQGQPPIEPVKLFDN